MSLNENSDRDFERQAFPWAGILRQEASKSYVLVAVGRHRTELERFPHLFSGQTLSAGVRHRQTGRDGERGRNDVQSAARRC